MCSNPHAAILPVQWLMLALRWSARENGLLAVFLLVCDMPAPASSRRNALLLLLLLLCCCCCCCYGCWPSGDVGLKVTPAERESRSARAYTIALHTLPCMHTPPSTHQHERKIPRTKNCTPRKNYMHTQEPGTHKNQELRMRPQELAPTTRPHTSPRTHFLALGRGCLLRSRR